ncbi:MAG: yceI [Gemmatimonadetes bacterium]|nr:yceI [Gemmatimonadota bacterium]
MLSRLFAAALLIPTLVAPVAKTPAPAKTAAVWNIDKGHSSVNFQIRHFVSKVRGSFSDFKGTITADPENWENAQIDVVINTPSITTSNERRDADLRSSNFFSVDTFPTITFKSTKIERKGDDAKIYGTLTMRGVSKDVVLEGHFNGIQKNSQGGDRVGFDASTTINRLDYGVKWNRAAEGGGVMLGDEVKIEINVEAVRAKT